MVELNHTPNGPLSDYVNFIWFNDGYKPSSPVERVLPSGSSQIIINLGERQFRHFGSSDLTTVCEYDDLILAGMHTGHVFLDSYTRVSTMGVVLKQGAIPALFQMPACEFRDQIVSLRALIGPEALKLRQKIKAASSPKEKLCLVESFLQHRLDLHYNLNPGIHFAIEQIREKYGIVSISGILDETGYSHRWFSEVFRNTVGVTPKQYARIQRFQYALGMLRHKETPNLANIAVQCGYFDQSHFIHDFRNCAGISPMHYYWNQGKTTNHLAIQLE